MWVGGVGVCVGGDEGRRGGEGEGWQAGCGKGTEIDLRSVQKKVFLLASLNHTIFHHQRWSWSWLWSQSGRARGEGVARARGGESPPIALAGEERKGGWYSPPPLHARRSRGSSLLCFSSVSSLFLRCHPKIKTKNKNQVTGGPDVRAPPRETEERGGPKPEAPSGETEERLLRHVATS